MHKYNIAVLHSKIAAHDGKEKPHVESHSDSTTQSMHMKERGHI